MKYAVKTTTGIDIAGKLNENRASEVKAEALWNQGLRTHTL